MTVRLVETQPQTATFEDFWKAYPKKVRKALARAKWDAIVGEGLKTKTLDRDSGTFVDIELKATPCEIVEGAKRYALTQREPNGWKLKDDGKYTAHPATWLNQGRWMDWT